jgi:cell division protein FtsN
MKTLMRPFTPRRHRGGTLLGFLLGMLFGLGVALGVAIYITKVPLPFMNKAQPRPASDAAEPKKDWDPNAGLPGRLPPKPEASAQPSEDAPAAPAPATPAPPSKSADPLGELARSRAEAAPPAPAVGALPTTSADPFQYFVQAGAYRTPEDAEQQRAKLSLMGLQPRVTERDQAGRTVYRVRLGPFDKREEADIARDRLSGNGIEAVVVRMQR